MTMTKTMTGLAVFVALAAGCVSYPDEVATVPIDEEDVEVHVSTTKTLAAPEVCRMADGEAKERCGRYGRSPEYVSFRQIAFKDNVWTGRGDGPVNRYSILYACIPVEPASALAPLPEYPRALLGSD